MAKRARVVLFLFAVSGVMLFSSQSPASSLKFCKVGLDYIRSFAPEENEAVLLDFLRRKEASLKIGAFLALAAAKSRSAAVIKALQKEAQGKDEVYKAYAVLDLAYLQAKLNKSMCQSLFKSPSSQVRIAVARIAGYSGQPDLLLWLRQAFRKEKDSLVKAEIIGAWARCAFREAAEEIEKSLASSDWIVRRSAVEALWQVDRAKAKDLLAEMAGREKNNVVRARIKVLLSEEGIRVKADEEDLSSKDALRQGSSLLALANLGQASILRPAEKILLDEGRKEDLRYYAASALAVLEKNMSAGKQAPPAAGDLCERLELQKGGVALEDILAQGLFCRKASRRRVALRLMAAYRPRAAYFLMGLADASPLVSAQTLASEMLQVESGWPEPGYLRKKILKAIIYKSRR